MTNLPSPSTLRLRGSWPVRSRASQALKHHQLGRTRVWSRQRHDGNLPVFFHAHAGKEAQRQNFRTAAKVGVCSSCLLLFLSRVRVSTLRVRGALCKGSFISLVVKNDLDSIALNGVLQQGALRIGKKILQMRYTKSTVRVRYTIELPTYPDGDNKPRWVQ